MKTRLTSLTEVLAYQLEGMYYAEKKLQHAVPICTEVVKSDALKQEVIRYGELAIDKRTKLKRIFSYLLVERFGRKNKVIDNLIEDTHEMLSGASTDHLRDAVLSSCIQTINKYKIASYEIALIIAIELNLETVSDLLQEIIAWEKETAATLAKMTFQEFSRIDKRIEMASRDSS